MGNSKPDLRLRFSFFGFGTYLFFDACYLVFVPGSSPALSFRFVLTQDSSASS